MSRRIRDIVIGITCLAVIAGTAYFLRRSQLHALPVVNQPESVVTCPIGIIDPSYQLGTSSFQPEKSTNCGGEVCELDPAPRDVPPAADDGQKAAVSESAKLDVKIADLRAIIDQLIKEHELQISFALKQFYDQTFNTNVDAQTALSSTIAILDDLYALVKNNSDALIELVNSDVGKAAQRAYFNRAFSKEVLHFGDIARGSRSNDKRSTLDYGAGWGITNDLRATVGVSGNYRINTSKINVSASYACKPNIGEAFDDLLSDGSWQAGIKLTAPTHILGKGVQNISVELNASNKKPITFKASLSYKF